MNFPTTHSAVFNDTSTVIALDKPEAAPDSRVNLTHALPQEPPTESDVRLWMRRNWTITRPTVDICGHKIDTESQPNTNCMYCWFAWFNAHAELVHLVDEIVQKHGPETIMRMRGLKFWKMYRKFLAVLNAMEMQQKEAETPNGE